MVINSKEEIVPWKQINKKKELIKNLCEYQNKNYVLDQYS
jgi:hypothetical protein